MAEILHTRYGLYKGKGVITHITTNLTVGEIEPSTEIASAPEMHEMFNLFGYKETSKEKRT